MKRLFGPGFTALLLCLAPQRTPASLDTDTNSGNLEGRSGRGPRTGRVVVEVLEISDQSPVAGVRVELVENGRILQTDANGQVVFRLRPGVHELRVHDLNGPGPAIRIDDVQADVVAGETVVVEVFDCGMCL